MKFYVRTADGQLEVPSYAELRVLYRQRFVDDEDEVRREGTERWVKAGQFPGLKGAREARLSFGPVIGWIVVAMCLVMLALFLGLHR